QVIATLLEGLLGSHAAHHPPYPRTERTAHHVEFLVFGHQSALAVGAVIVGALHLHRRQYGENLFAAVRNKFGGMSLATIKVRATVTSAVAVEQLLQQNTAHLMHGGTNRHFAGFQVQVPQSLAIL